MRFGCTASAADGRLKLRSPKKVAVSLRNASIVASAPSTTAICGLSNRYLGVEVDDALEIAETIEV